MSSHPEVPAPRVSMALPQGRVLFTWGILGLILVAFVAETLAGGSTDSAVLTRLGAKVTPLIAEGEFWRLFTAMFLHIGFVHLGFNAYALVAIGQDLERIFGSTKFLFVYLFSGLLGSLASYAFSPHLSAGASGAIFGLVGAWAAYLLLHRRNLGTWGQRRLANVAFLIAINLFLGFTRPGIDNLAHLGGLLGGFALGLGVAPRYEVDAGQLRLVDRHRLVYYWPALVGAAAVLVAGVYLATQAQLSDANHHVWLGQQAIDREDWPTAVRELGIALAEDPSVAEAALYFYLGLGHNELNQPEEAVEAYRLALSLEPDDANSHWNLALTYLELDRLAEARVHFESYLSLRPDDIDSVQPFLDALEQVGS